MDIWTFAINNGVAVACLFVMATWGKQALDNNTKALYEIKEVLINCKYKNRKL